MPTVLDTEILPEVLDVIETYGKTVTVSQVGVGTYDPTTGVGTPDSTTPYSAKASPPDRFDNALIDNDNIQVGDTYIIFAGQGLAFTPRVGMKVTIDSVIWRCIAVTPFYSGEQIAAWEVHLRK